MTESVMASYQHVQLARNLEGRVNVQAQMTSLQRERREGLLRAKCARGFNAYSLQLCSGS